MYKKVFFSRPFKQWGFKSERESGVRRDFRLRALFFRPARRVKASIGKKGGWFDYRYEDDTPTLK